MDIANGTSQDCNGNSIPDECDIASGTSLDVLPPGGDGIPDECQSDCNGNLIPDNLELLAGPELVAGLSEVAAYEIERRFGVVHDYLLPSNSRPANGYYGTRRIRGFTDDGPIGRAP